MKPEDVHLCLCIQLPDGCEIFVDPEDAERVTKESWVCRHRVRPNKRTGVYAHKYGHTAETLHRFILNARPHEIIDHINHDGLDNRSANLRIVTNSENMQNRNGANRNSKTGVRGVSVFNIRRKKYYGIRVWLGKTHPSGKQSVCKYFPYTDEGFAEACRMAPILRSELMTHSVEG